MVLAAAAAVIQPQHERIERGPGDPRLVDLGDGQ